MPDGAAGGSRKGSPHRVAGGSGKRPQRAGAPRGAGAIRWLLVPLAVGAVLAAALLAEALVAGARDAVVHTSVLLGAGDLTIEPEGARDGAPGGQVLLESGALFSNPALMRLPGRAVARVELRGTVGAGALRQAAQLVGVDGPSDPQAVLLSRFLGQGVWPEAEPLGGPGRHDIVLGATLSGRLGLAVGDAIGIGAEEAPAGPPAPRASAPHPPAPPPVCGAGGAQAGECEQSLPAPREGTAPSGAESQSRALRGRGPRAGARGWQGHVAGVLRTGLPELDAGRVWTGLASAQELLPVAEDERAEAATRIAVYLDQPVDAARWMSAVRLTLPEGAEVLTWREVYPDALPWGPWQVAQSRVAWLAFAGVALAAAAGGIVAGLIGWGPAARAPLPSHVLAARLNWIWASRPSSRWASRKRSAGSAGPAGPALRAAWRLLGPGLLGLAVAAVLYAIAWAALRAAPLPAAAVFSRLGTELNPFDGLTQSLAPALDFTRALELGLTGAGVFGAAAALCLAVARRERQ